MAFRDGDAGTQLSEVGLREVLVPKPEFKVEWTAVVELATVEELGKQSELNFTDPTLEIGNSGSIASLNARLTDPSVELIANHILRI